MQPPTPLFTRENCTFAHPLQWGLSVFWRSSVADAPWFPELVGATEPDGIRLLGHRFAQPGVSQFTLSTRPEVTPLLIVQRVKGRLQYLVRSSLPKALQANYALRSIGRVNREVIEGYVASQLDHHLMADERVQKMLGGLQIHQPEINLDAPRRTGQGLYWYNLHVVLVHRERWAEIREAVLGRVREMILKVCRVKNYALSRAGILADHIHLAVGCPLEVAPVDVALAFLNNLAYVHEMRPVFQYGAYVGTFGEYDQGAIHSEVTREGLDT
jgi:REP element-mobilizing transposase RayT